MGLVTWRVKLNAKQTRWLFQIRLSFTEQENLLHILEHFWSAWGTREAADCSIVPCIAQSWQQNYNGGCPFHFRLPQNFEKRKSSNGLSLWNRVVPLGCLFFSTFACYVMMGVAEGRCFDRTGGIFRQVRLHSHPGVEHYTDVNPRVELSNNFLRTKICTPALMLEFSNIQQ
jgi:hypothetical protein